MKRRPPARCSWTLQGKKESEMHKVTMILVVFAAVAQLTSAWPGGAPEVACEDLTPGHNIAAQPDPAPYHIMTLSDTNKTVFEITLMANPGTDYFRGFMMQARDPATGLPVGVFTVESTEASTLNCFEGVANTATHSTRTKKMNVTLTWTPPDTPLKDAAITYSVVQEKETFWVKQQHMMEVNKGGLSAFNFSLSLCFSVVFLVLKIQ